jgi:hypothetical protein
VPLNVVEKFPRMAIASPSPTAGPTMGPVVPLT